MAQNGANNNNNPLLKVKISGHKALTNDFACPTCPMIHMYKICPKEKKDTDFKIDFTKLPDVLQKRFIDLANIYEKSKLQKVCKSINRMIHPETYQIACELIAHGNPDYPEEDRFWCGRGTTLHVHPEYESHIPNVHDLIVNGKFNGVNLPNNWITKVLNQNVCFYLNKLHLENCELTESEFRALCEYDGLEHVFLENISVTPPPKIYELAIWLTNAKTIRINIKNFKCDPNWPKYFYQFSDKRIIKQFVFMNASMKFNAIDLDKFIRTKVIDNPESTVRIYFDEDEMKKLSKKVIQKKLDRILNGVFKRVIKAQFESFAPTDRFIIDSRRKEKSSKVYFYVNCRALDTMVTKAKMENLSINDSIAVGR